MKYLTVLQAPSSTQAQREAYGHICTDRNIGTWKASERGAVAGCEALSGKAVPKRYNLT